MSRGRGGHGGVEHGFEDSDVAGGGGKAAALVDELEKHGVEFAWGQGFQWVLPSKYAIHCSRRAGGEVGAGWGVVLRNKGDLIDTLINNTICV